MSEVENYSAYGVRVLYRLFDFVTRDVSSNPGSYFSKDKNREHCGNLAEAFLWQPMCRM